MYTEIVRNRKSVRTYKEQPIPEETLNRVRDYLEHDTGLFNVPVAFSVLNARETGVSSPFGYAFEKFILYATLLGLGTVWLAATIDRKAFEKAVQLKEDEVMPAVTPIGYAAEKRSIRESMMRKGMKSDSRIPFEELFFDDNFQNPLNENDAGIWKLPLEMVRLAPSATNKQPWRVAAEKDQVHFYERKTKGYAKEATGDIQKVDLGIALIHTLILISESETPMNSDQIAESVGTNASYIRKLTTRLSKAGMIEGRRGVSGFRLGMKPEDISLLDIYKAVMETDSVHLFDLHQNPNDACIVGHNIRPVLGGMFRDMEESVEKRLQGMTLADCIDNMQEYIRKNNKEAIH